MVSVPVAVGRFVRRTRSHSPGLTLWPRATIRWSSPRQAPARFEDSFRGETEFRSEGGFPTVDADAGTVNPFQAPSYADATAEVEDRPHSGVLWLLFSFAGRIPRRVYWPVYLVTTFYTYVFNFTVIAVFGEGSDLSTALALANLPLVLWISLANYVKRWHDVGKSGWWVLICLIPCIGPLWQFVELGFSRGTYGPNHYGPDPT